MGKYNKILVAFDGSESGKNALLQAFRLADTEKCWLTVTSVIPHYEGELDLTGVKDIRASFRKPCDEALAMAEGMAKKERVLIKTVCEEGEVYERIVDLAEAENCDLIVMGRRGLKRIERAFVGSVTARVIGYGGKDVLVVPENTALSWKSIVFATDGSKFSDAALERALNFAKSYGGALEVISVVDLPAEFYAESVRVSENLIKNAREFVNGSRQKAKEAGVTASAFVGEGEAYKVITDFAAEKRAGLIVMGSHGRTGLKRLLMGSVAEKVIGYAPCPVLIVK